MVQIETAAVEKLSAINLYGSVGICLEAAGLATQVLGKAFPSSMVPGAQCIAQRRAYGVV